MKKSHVCLTWVTPCCPWPVAILGTAVMILAGAPVPEVITLVVIIVMGDLMPGLLVTPALGKGPEKISYEGVSSFRFIYSTAKAF